jgi:uncharacterized RDD family membrane protein YckC
MGPGVYYAPEAYAGFLKRLLIVAVDLSVIFFVWAIVYILWYGGGPDPEYLGIWFVGLCFTVAYIYLVFVESSSIGTLGFLLTKVKIVNLRGERPSGWRVSFRLFLWVLGPFHPVIDLLWLTGDRDRQTLRDKLAGTYVVRKDALPCGQGTVRLSQYFLFGLSILFPESRTDVPWWQHPIP